MPFIVALLIAVIIVYVQSLPWTDVIFPILSIVAALLAILFTFGAMFGDKISRGQRAGMLCFSAVLLIPGAFKSYDLLFGTTNAVVMAEPAHNGPAPFVFQDTSKWVSDDDAFAVAAHILTKGKKTGCGSFDVVWRDDEATHIRVKCYDGRTWELENGPILKINGEFVSY